MGVEWPRSLFYRWNIMNHKLALSLTSLLLTNVVSAATQVDLKQQSANYIKPYLTSKSAAKANSSVLNKVRIDTDFNHTMHVRLQQMYKGVPVWNATSIVHLPMAHKKLSLLANLSDKTTMNGVVYEGLESDLTAIPSYALANDQKVKAMQEAKLVFEKKMGAVNLKYTDESIKTIVYIDADKKAHYGFLISFYYDDGNTGAHRPISIIDAESLQAYRTWDGVMTENSSKDNGYVLAGGIGGNEKIGEAVYDGFEGHLPGLTMRNIEWKINSGGANITYVFCFLMNENVTIYDMAYGSFAYGMCGDSEQHNNTYWLSHDNSATRWKKDEANGGYSPSLDAFYNATIVNNFYKDWYGVPALVEADGKTPMMLTMRVHYGRQYDNAFWDGQQMTFGDGGSYFYPLTSLGITAHEISHGFTEQHSNLNAYEPQMGALNEAFSDEAAVAMQYYATGKITWDIGRDVTKTEGALRYLDDPKKDGHSIDNMKDFDDTEPHYGAGIFNKAFYLIATSKGWDIQKAFNVMIKANMNYWTSSMTTLSEAACGVSMATQDYGYNLADVRVAFIKVGIDIADCGPGTTT